MIAMKAALLFLQCSLLSVLGFAQGSWDAQSAQVDQETIDLLEKLQKDLKISPSTSQLDCGANSADKCDFTFICNKLRSNRNSKALYQNSKGQVIPNYKLLYLQETVDQCRNTVSSSTSAPTNSVSDSLLVYLKERKSLLDSIQAHGEEAKMIRLEQAMLDASIEKPDDPSSMTWTMPRDQIEKYISDAETRAGVKLSDESRNKWVELLLEETSDGPNVATQTKTKVSSDDNPFMKTELLTNVNEAGSKEKVLEYQTQFQNELNRSFDVFTDTKSQLIAVLNKRRNGKNDAEIENMISRIRKIKMKAPEVSGMFPMAGCSSPNAFYDPTSHSFTLCPQLLQMPSATIQTVIAHELGHSIDPCNATFPLSKVDGTLKPNPYSANMGDAEQMGILMFEPTLPDQGTEEYAAFDLEFLDISLAIDYDSLSFKEQQQSIDLAKNPFASVIQCLQSYGSVEARIGDVSKAKLAVSKKISDLQWSGATDDDPNVKDLKQTLERIDSVYEDKKVCSFIGSHEGRSQMQEAFSDWIASEVIASKITTAANRQEGQQIAFESNAYFAALDCLSFDLDIANTAKNTLEKAGCLSTRSSRLHKDLENMRTDDDPHPKSYNRINKIFMANPTTAAALSCQKRSEVKHCE